MPAPNVTFPRTFVMGNAGASPYETAIVPVNTVLIPTEPTTYTFGVANDSSEIVFVSPSIGTYGGRVEFTATRDLSLNEFFGLQIAQFGWPFQWPDPDFGPPYLETLANGGVSIVVFDSSGNWSEFNIFGREYTNTQLEEGGWGSFRIVGITGCNQIVINRGQTPDNTSGVLDWSAVDGFELIMRVTEPMASSGTFQIGGLLTFDVPYLTDGEVADSGGFDDVSEAIRASTFNFQMADVYKSTTGNFNGGIGEIYEPRYSHDIGDGSTFTYFRDTGTTLTPYPIINSGNETLPSLLEAPLDRGLTINQSSTDDVVFNGTIFAATSILAGNQDFVEVIGDSGGTCNFNGCQFYNKTRVILGHSSSTNATIFDNCEYVEINSDSDIVSAILRNTSATSRGLYVQSAAGDYSNIALVFDTSVGGDGITINPPATGTWDFTGITVASGLTLNIHNESAVTAITVEIPAGIAFSTSTAGGTVTVIQPTSTFTINSNETASLIQIFTAGTTTLLDSTTGSSLAFAHSGQTVDYVVQKAGFLPQRFTNLLLSGNITVDVNLVEDLVYDGAHGLTYGVDLSFDRNTRLLSVLTTQQGVDIYSALIDAYTAQATLLNTPFDVQTNGDSSYIFNNDMEFDAVSSINNFKRAGVEYRATGGAVTAQWCSIFTLSTVPVGVQAKYQQEAGLNTTNAINTEEIDQAIQIFGDATHGNFTLNTHLVIKYLENTYSQVRVDLVDLYQLTTIDPTGYPIATPFSSLSIAAGDPAISITIVDHTAAPINVGGVLFDYEVIDNGVNSGEDILRELNYNTAQGVVYQGKLPFNWPDIVTELGTGYDTTRGAVEDESGLHGFYVSLGGSDHPDFIRFQGNDGTYYTPAVVNVAETSGMLAGSNIYVYNITTDTDIVNAVQPGGDWVLLYNEGNEFTSGDEVRVRVCYENGADYRLPIETFVIAGPSGFTVPIAQEDWVPVNQLGIDGSLVTEFALDTMSGNLQIDINDPNGETTKERTIAFSAYSLGSSPIAIKFFFGGLLVEDVANYRVIVSKADIQFDNVGIPVIFTDTDTRMYRDDGSSLVAAGSNTIILESGKVYVAAGGGGGGDATEANQQQILAELGEIKGAGFDTNNDSLVQIRDNIGGGGGDATEAKQDQILAEIAEVQGAGFDTNVNSLVNVTTDISNIDAGDATEANQTTIIDALTDIHGVGFDTNDNSLVNITDDITGISAGDATEAKQDQILTNQAALDTKLDTKSSQSSVDSVQVSVDNLPTVQDFIDGMTVDGELFEEWVLILRDSVNTIVDDGNGNATVRGKNGTQSRLTYVYDEITGSRTLTGIDYTT